MMAASFLSSTALLLAALLLIPPVAVAQGAGTVEAVLRASTAEVPGVTVDAAGLTRAGHRLWVVEPVAPEDGARRKLVVVGGLDGSAEGAAAVAQLVRWWHRDAAAAGLRQNWYLSALPCAQPASCDAGTAAAPAAEPLTFPPPGGFFDGKLDPTPHYVWRWVTMQAPTVVVEVRTGGEVRWAANALAASIVPGTAAPPAASDAPSLMAALGEEHGGPAWSAPVPAVTLTAPAGELASAVTGLLERAGAGTSPLRTRLTARQSRAPLDVARLLAPKYPAQPIMSYIPALAWSGALELAQRTGEAGFRTKPLADMAPFLSGDKPAIAEPYLLTSLAGHLAFSDLGAMDGNAEASALARRAADFILPQSDAEIVRFPRAWTDDMFMATSVLARVADREQSDVHAAVVERLLLGYAEQLQRPDGLFIHAKEGPHTWGRGNGFAAFGLMEALTHMPESWAPRARVLEHYQQLMRGLQAHQAPDGMWRQVVDEPGSYREMTVTAMTVTAMARGIRLGWLPASYRATVDRAWHGVLARVAEDGTLMDVCTGTGSGPTKDYYLNRAGITGADDRGGAMVLVAALEMDKLR